MSDFRRYWKPSHYESTTLPDHTEVAIVGAGIAGLGLAKLLNSHNIDCCVIEEHHKLGRGISAGQQGAARLGLADNSFRIHNGLGLSETERLLSYTQSGINELSSIDALKQTGGFELAESAQEWEELQQSHLLLSTLGIETALCSPPAFLGAAAKYHGALHLPCEGTVNQHKLIDQISEGIKIVNTSVTELLDRDLLLLRTPIGDLRATVAVIANGWKAQQLHPLLGEAITPTRLQTIAIPSAQRYGQVCSAQYGYLEWRHTASHLLISGCRWATPHLELGESDDQVFVKRIGEQLEKAARRIGNPGSPSHRWSSIMATSCDQLPVIGPLQSSSPIYACCGFNGRQTTLGLRAARSILRFLVDGDDPELPDSCRATRLSSRAC